MDVYVDASVVLRRVFGQADALTSWPEIERPVSNELARVECLRTLDRARVRGLSDALFADRRAAVLQMLDSIRLIPVTSAVLNRAGDPFPTSIGTLDGIHLASALLARAEVPGLVLATHDQQLGLGARAMGFEVLGLPSRGSGSGGDPFR